MIGLEGREPTADECRLLEHPLVGGVILFARNLGSPEQLVALTSRLHELRSPPLLVAVDQEGGRVQRCRDGFTPLPPARRYGERFDASPEDGLAAARAGGLVMAGELRERGVDFSFAPVLDLDLGRSSVIGDRAFHADPAVVNRLAAAWVDGMRDGGMPSTGKHFPGHGGVGVDSHLALPVDERSLSTLESADLAPYGTLIASRRLDAVMTAHVVYPAVDSMPASFSSVWIGQVLRHRLGFDGLVVADDLGMEGAASLGAIPERATAALDAGADLVMVCNQLDAVTDVIRCLEGREDCEARRRLSRFRELIGAPPPAARLAEARDLLAT